jgi:His/Glu/Gln/Arg/opine family amino acid ABC transporter permease subunit
VTSRRANRWISVGMTVVALAIGIPWLWHAYEHRAPWWDPILHQLVHEGLKETLRMAALSVVGAVVIGIVLGTLLTVEFKPSRALIRGYIEIWRGLPIVVTMFIFAYAYPLLDQTFPQIPFDIKPLQAFEAATVTLVLWGSAQVAEATRGAVQSIPREQHEAAAALGFGWVGRHVFVIVPQAVRRLIPPLIGLVVNIIQNTTIALIIGVQELLQVGTRSTERLLYGTGDSHFFAIYTVVAAMFFAISFPLTRVAALLEKRLA